MKPGYRGIPGKRHGDIQRLKTPIETRVPNGRSSRPHSQKAGGRVSGPKGAAARLQIPPSTLESKLKKFKISKNDFKFG
jgi:hypothetical protein